MFVSTFLAAVLSLAPIASATAAWLNSGGPPPTAGRVTIVDVFTYGCINCQHVTPQLQKLHAAIPAADLAIVGVHTPETPEERNHANVRRALRDQKIVWPVVFDDDSRLWNAFRVEAWPTQLVFDRRGKLRATIVGEGQDAQLERIVRGLIAERG
jgi:thiol-disulfide isomerase/thioredoxin